MLSHPDLKVRPGETAFFILIGSDISGGDTGGRLHFDTGNNAHGYKGGQNGASPVADKGKGQADNGNDPQANADVYHDLEQEHGGHADTDQVVGIILRCRNPRHPYALKQQESVPKSFRGRVRVLWGPVSEKIGNQRSLAPPSEVAAMPL